MFLYQGHIETIFDCQFHPDDPDLLATGSFDGTIKIWDMTTLKPVIYHKICLLLLELVYLYMNCYLLSFTVLVLLVQQ